MLYKYSNWMSLNLIYMRMDFYVQYITSWSRNDQGLIKLNNSTIPFWIKVLNFNALGIEMMSLTSVDLEQCYWNCVLNTTFPYLIVVFYGFVDISARDLSKERKRWSETERTKYVNIKVWLKVEVLMCWLFRIFTLTAVSLVWWWAWRRGWMPPNPHQDLTGSWEWMISPKLTANRQHSRANTVKYSWYL